GAKGTLLRPRDPGGGGDRGSKAATRHSVLSFCGSVPTRGHPFSQTMVEICRNGRPVVPSYAWKASKFSKIDCPPGPRQRSLPSKSSVAPPSIIGLPDLSTYGPVILSDRPTTILYVLCAPRQQRSCETNR